MNLTLKEYISKVESGSLSPQEVVNHYLAKAKQENTKLNAFVRFHEDYAQTFVSDYTNKPLHAAPIGVKDIIMTKGYISSCASKMLEDFVSPYNATCFEKLEQAGGLMLGKTNMDEFAMGGSTEHSAFGPCINPHGTGRVSGGSSGGSAAAVAADMCIAALGTDTGGSVRGPAAFCGIVGLKPTYGRISRYGVQSMASSFDQVGVITKTVDDAEILLKTISGHDPKDAQSSQKANTWETSPHPLKIAVPKEAMAEGLNPKIKARYLETIEKLRAAGYQVDEISLPLLDAAVSIYYTLVNAEVSTNMARFDGIRYGKQDDMSKYPDVQSYYSAMRSAGFGDEVKRRILLGTFVLSSANYEGYYLKAQKARQQFKRDFAKIFSNYDIILTPTTPGLAWKLGEKAADPLQEYLEDLYTVPVNIGGLPAMSVPSGFIEDQGEQMPVGMQIIADKWQEEKLFDLGRVIEKLFA